MCESLKTETAGIITILVIPAVPEVCLLQLLPVVGFSVWYCPCHRIKPSPGVPLHRMELLLFFFALLGERHIFFHVVFSSTNLKLYESRYANETNRLSLLHYHFSSPSPPIRRVISSIRSKGNGGDETGFMASDISFMGLSSAAIRLELNAPHILQR